MQTRRGQRVRALLAALACVGGTAVGCGDDDKKGCERLCDNLDRCEFGIEDCVENCVVEGRADREYTLAVVQCVDEAPEGNCGAIQSCLSGVVPVGTGGGSAGCSDICQTAFDNECDDGGPGALFDLCSLGTDCNDCGPRGLCSDDCATSFDLECDDGGPGALYDLCALGTDCSDCGVR